MRVSWVGRALARAVRTVVSWLCRMTDMMSRRGSENGWSRRIWTKGDARDLRLFVEIYIELRSEIVHVTGLFSADWALLPAG
jgi:hypothetical protein